MTTPAGQARLTLRVAGRHNVRNALAATAARWPPASPLADIVRGLEAFAPVKGRSQLKSLRRGGRTLTLVDDTYNANPDSVRAAIDVLAGLPAPRLLVLGDMGEVGDQGPAFHAGDRRLRAGARHRHVLVRRRAVRARRAAYGAGARHFADTPALLAALGDSHGRRAGVRRRCWSRARASWDGARGRAAAVAHDDNDKEAADAA